MFLTLPWLQSDRKKYPWLPRWAQVNSEAKVHPHCEEECAHLFHAHNTGSTELEVLHWLNATVRVLKPKAIVETGVCDGLGTAALASACRDNGMGVVHAIELDPALCKKLESNLKQQGLRDFVEIHCMDSRDFLKETDVTFGLGFFDSICEIRADEFRICLDRGIIRNFGVFHDTSPTRTRTMAEWPREELHKKYRDDLKALGADPRCTGLLESTLSRGFVAIGVRNP